MQVMKQHLTLIHKLKDNLINLYENNELKPYLEDKLKIFAQFYQLNYEVTLIQPQPHQHKFCNIHF